MDRTEKKESLFKKVWLWLSNKQDKNIQDNIIKDQNENNLKVIDNKIIYTKNRIDFYSKNEDYNKALDMLNNFYDNNQEDEKAISFYNKEKFILDALLVWKKPFWKNLFWEKNNYNDKVKWENLKNEKKEAPENNQEKKEIEIIWNIEQKIEDSKNESSIKEENTTPKEVIESNENNNIEVSEISKGDKNWNEDININKLEEKKLWIKLKIRNGLDAKSIGVEYNQIKEDWKNQEKVELLEPKIENNEIKLWIQKNKQELNNINLVKIGHNLIQEEENSQEKTENVNEKEKNKFFISNIFGLSGLKEEKTIDLLTIVDFDWAIKWIRFFINIKDWVKAKSWIEEVKQKEEKAFNLLYDKLDLQKEKRKQKDLYDKKLQKIQKLKNLLEDEKNKYNKKIEIEKFRVKFIQIKEMLDELIWWRKYYEAMNLINSFFEENKDSIAVIEFSNKWKNILQKKIKNQEGRKEKEISKNIRKEAEDLIWEHINLWNENISTIIDKKDTNISLLEKLIDKFNLYKKLKIKLKEKNLIDEITFLIESQNEINELSKRNKLENMHMWLIKEIENDRLLWYELYAKILWKDKITGDTFWFMEDDTTYKFFLWDATWHWIQAWLIVTLLTRLFYKFSKNNFLEKIVFEINNWLKQDLRSWNFITAIFFEIDKKNLDNIQYIWMGHEPILIYRKSTMKIEKLVAWWLAAWIRLIGDIEQIKTRSIKLNDWDIVFVYSDWIVESRNSDNKLLWIDWLSDILEKICLNFTLWKNIDLYSSIIEELKIYRWWSSNFFDDATIFIMKRNTDKDLLDKKSVYLKNLSIEEWLSKKNIHELEWKTKEEAEIELLKIRREKQLKLIISNLEKLYITWEILKLKQEAIRYIKEWFIHKKINLFLKKAIENERQYKIDLKTQKMKSKYSVLKDLLKKWDYDTVIKEANEIISSDWNITI